MRTANERWRYNVKSSLIGRAHTEGSLNNAYGLYLGGGESMNNDIDHTLGKLIGPWEIRIKTLNK